MIQTTLNLKNIENPVNPVFANHETFHPRFGWLKKGFDAAKKNPDIFSQDDAPVRLGVGKNMVRAIRYWSSAFKILDKNNLPTRFGEKLLGNNGWDVYLEDPASLWLLHWNLLKPTCEAAAWYYIFNIFRDLDFTKEDILAGLKDYIKIYQLIPDKINSVGLIRAVATGQREPISHTIIRALLTGVDTFWTVTQKNKINVVRQLVDLEVEINNGGSLQIETDGNVSR